MNTDEILTKEQIEAIRIVAESIYRIMEIIEKVWQSISDMFREIINSKEFRRFIVWLKGIDQDGSVEEQMRRFRTRACEG